MALPKTMPISTLASRKWTNAVMKWYWNEPMNWTCSTSPSWSTWTCHFHWGGLLVQLFGPSWGLNRAMALQSRRWCNRRLQNEDHQGFKQHGTITEDHGKEDTHVFQIEVATVTVSGVNENLFNSEYTALEETPKQTLTTRCDSTIGKAPQALSNGLLLQRSPCSFHCPSQPLPFNLVLGFQTVWSADVRSYRSLQEWRR